MLVRPVYPIEKNWEWLLYPADRQCKEAHSLKVRERKNKLCREKIKSWPRQDKKKKEGVKKQTREVGSLDMNHNNEIRASKENS